MLVPTTTTNNKRITEVQQPLFRDGLYVYSPVGFCIYCGAKKYDTKRPVRSLATEHIIPEGLGGKLILPEAACAKCEGITASFEGACQRRIFGPLRIKASNLPTKRPKERPGTLPINAFFVEESPKR